jgi:hypothetical protein
MDTTASATSCIESGQHATSAQTLEKVGDAFGGRAVVGFEFGPAKRPEREVVAL